VKSLSDGRKYLISVTIPVAIGTRTVNDTNIQRVIPALHVSNACFFTVLNVQYNRADTIDFYRRVDTENFAIYFVFTILS
jgi:hypothetical protein